MRVGLLCFQSLQEYPKHPYACNTRIILMRFQSLQEYPKLVQMAIDKGQYISFQSLQEYPKLTDSRDNPIFFLVSNPYRNILSLFFYHPLLSH